MTKNPPAYTGDSGSIPGSGRFLGAGNGNLLQYSCLESLKDQGALQATVHGVAEGRTRLSDFTLIFTFMHWRRKWQPTPVFLPGESQGQGAWWAAVYGVAQSQTRLKRLSHSNKYEGISHCDFDFHFPND